MISLWSEAPWTCKGIEERHQEGFRNPNKEYNSCRHLSVTSSCPAFGLFCRNLKFVGPAFDKQATCFYFATTRLYFIACRFFLVSRPNSAQGAALLSTKLRVLSVLLPQLQKRGTWSLHGTMSSMPALHAISVANLQFQTFTGHRCLIFSHSVRMLDLIQAMKILRILLCKQLLLQVPCIYCSHIIRHPLPSCWKASQWPGLCAQSVGAEVLAHWWQHWRKGVLLKLGILQSHTDLHQDSDNRLVCDKYQ